MHSREKKKQALKVKGIRIIILLLIVLIVIITINTIKIKKKNKEPVIDNDLSNLNGTYIYSDDVKYSFDNTTKKGTLVDKGNEYKYSYEIKDQQIILTFEDKKIEQATYSAYFINGNLKLTGGKGTIGGEYILIKEK